LKIHRPNSRFDFIQIHFIQFDSIDLSTFESFSKPNLSIFTKKKINEFRSKKRKEGRKEGRKEEERRTRGWIQNKKKNEHEDLETFDFNMIRYDVLQRGGRFHCSRSHQSRYLS
jgi:hypothetical protein